MKKVKTTTDKRNYTYVISWDTYIDDSVVKGCDTFGWDHKISQKDLDELNRYIIEHYYDDNDDVRIEFTSIREREYEEHP